MLQIEDMNCWPTHWMQSLQYCENCPETVQLKSAIRPVHCTDNLLEFRVTGGQQTLCIHQTHKIWSDYHKASEAIQYMVLLAQVS